MRIFRLVVLLCCAAWLVSGWTDRAKEELKVAGRRKYWAFQKPVRADAPAIQSAWIRTPIDAFLLEALQAKKLAPSPPLDKQHLVRRVYLDLTGLPPTPVEADTFLRARSADAYEKLVDRLLASPHYGERWALKWLDVVRYADTNGFELDAERTHAWRYRDYVIRAFNTDKPYDRFIKEQIAGDELWPGDHDALIATGFHRAGPIHLVGGNQDEEMNRQEVLTEMTATVSSALIGMTVGCARCHDHKFDPILQSDYYRLQAVFAGTEGKDIEIAPAEEKARCEREKKEYEARLAPVQAKIDEIEKPVREKIEDRKRAALETKYKEALAIPEDKRSPEQKELAKEGKDQSSASWDEVVSALSPQERAARAELRKELHAIEKTAPDPPATAYAVANMEKDPPETHILKVGDPHHKLDAVEPGFPTVLTSYGVEMPKGAAGRRTALANWVTSPENPLTARVMANRIWQLRMGTGLVRTANDFGVLGARPSNQKLLDWLAVEFVERGWSVKAMDRMILLSSAYRQSAANVPDKSKVDPDNNLYWRANRKRLEGEYIRDSVLTAAGTLNPTVGGKPVRTPIEKEIYDLIFTEGEPDNLWPLSEEAQHTRRSLYLINKRTVRLPMLANFDQPDEMSSCPVRPVSTHALQALTLFNSDLMQQQSKAFAARLVKECGRNEGCEVRHAYKLALARGPRAEEVKMAGQFFRDKGSLADFCLALLNRNEFVYVP